MTSCPANSIRYNGTLCACSPGYYPSAAGNGNCTLFAADAADWEIESGVGTAAAPEFLTTVLPLDNLRRITQSQAVLLEATLVALVAWLLFCLALRLAPLHGGRTVWFRVRWWISRLDCVFSTSHWLDDHQVVLKRKTELGGTFSVASWIVFIGLLSALLYQVITKRTIEVHRVRPVNAPDLLSFVNDLEFNITTVSGMSCSHLRGLDKLVIGTPGFIDYRVFPLSTYANSSCQNTSIGPTISIKCNSCQIPRRNHYISWQFVDLPNAPAMAVGFQFKLTAKDHGNDKHVSFVSGALKSDGRASDKPKTFRGPDLNVLKIHLFPQIYNNLHDLKLIQPLFHDFLPGSSFSDANGLQASLQRSKDGLINTTLLISYLSDYIVEIDDEYVMGIVGFLADVGGIFAISLAIFLYFLVQCEARIKRLRSEDSVMRNIRNQRRAQINWDKLRKYVAYTWGPSSLDVNNTNSKQNGISLTDSFGGISSPNKVKQPNQNDSEHLHKMTSAPNKMQSPQTTGGRWQSNNRHMESTSQTQ